MITDEQLRALRQQANAIDPDPATDRQQNYITILIEDRVVPTPWLFRIRYLVEHGLTKQKASQIIGHLKALPRDPKALDNREGSPDKVTPMTLPSGRYAIEVSDSRSLTDNDIAFYKIKWNKEGTRFWVDQIVGPNSTEAGYPIRTEIVKLIIRAGVGASAALYGHKIGRCSICHTQITNRLSRELGTGPVCGGRVFTDWETRRNNARTSLLERGLDPNENVEDDR